MEAVYAAVASPAELLEAVAQHKPDIAFSSFFRFGAGGAQGGGAQGGGALYLRDLLLREGVAWIGSSSETMELALSKPRMKAVWRASGISTPAWFTIRRNPQGSIDGLEFLESARSFPYIVKPANEGNSRGIDPGSVVHSPLELYARAALIAEEFGEVLVENYVAGSPDSREMTVAMIGNGSHAIVSGIEIHNQDAASGPVTEGAKEGHRTRPSSIADASLKARVESLALRAFLSAGIRDYSRCDILYHEGRLYVLEINGQPMLPDSWFEACAREAGLGPTQYLQAVIVAGIRGNAQTGHAFIPLPRAMARALPPELLARLDR
jgi:D-alanine-D-alanine ligase